MNLVSIIIPVYNINFFREAFNSAYNQSYKKKEIIIIYDNDKKEYFEKINKIILKKKNIRLINNKKNLGAGIARNIGIKYAKGAFLAFLDSDDKWNKDKLKIQIKFMNDYKLNFTHTSYNIIDEKNKLIGEQIAKKILTYNNLLNSCDIGLSTVVVKKKIILNNSFSNLKTKEDYVLWLKLSKKNQIIGIQKKLCNWRKSSNSLSSSVFRKIFDAFQVYYKKENLNFFVSIFRVFILSYNYLFKRIRQKIYF
jgi:teichuronic acid biosynthesis glycosyltransferase TuaG